MPDDAKKRSKSLTEHDRSGPRAPDVLKSNDPDEIASAQERSGEDLARGSIDPYRPAMSMLDFYLNRTGRNLSAKERAALERAKNALQKRLGKPES
jgi:hypothetical protein